MSTMVYKVRTFFQIEYFKGWSDKKHDVGYVRHDVFVESEKSPEELSACLREQLKTSHLTACVEYSKRKGVKALSEEEFIERAKNAKLVIQF